MKGNGIPTVGKSPRDIPIFTVKCENNKEQIQKINALRKLFVCFSAWLAIRIINIDKTIISPKLPMKPHSSPTVVKI